MNSRTIIMFDDQDEEIVVADAIAAEQEEESEIAENADDIEEMIRRQDDIDQLTSDYIIALMGMTDYNFDISEFGIDTKELSAIEDEFEAILYEHGITIYRPVMCKDANGEEIIVSSIYEERQ